MTELNVPFLPTFGNPAPADSFLMTYSQTGADPCHLYVQEAAKNMTQMVNLTSTTLLQTEHLLEQAGLVDWQGRAAETFRNTLLHEMRMVHEQRLEIHRTGLMLEAAIRL